LCSFLLWSSSVQSQSTTQLLNDSNKKVDILNNIIDNSTLVTEFATAMRNPVMMSDTSKMKHTPNMKKMNMPADTATVYTCPMHPEVTASKPGKCPKCGMDLVKKPIKKKIEKSDMKMI